MHHRSATVRLVIAAAAVLPWAHCAIAAQAPGANPAAGVERIIKALQAPDAPVLELGQQLAALPAACRRELERRLEGNNPDAVMACAYALLQSPASRKAVAALEGMVLNAKLDLARRREAAVLLVERGGALGIARARLLLDRGTGDARELPEALQVTCLASLLKMTNRVADCGRLRKLARKASNLRTRTRAVLALARTGYLRGLEGDLERLRSMPGPIGEQAEVLLQLNHHQQELARNDRLAGQLVNEVMYDLRRYYAPDARDKNEQRQLKTRNLASMAARAMLNSVDPFSDYLTAQDWKDMEDSLHSNYGGIGAWVGMRNGQFTILTPMFGKPAFKAGLRSMDVVEKINGKPIKGMRLQDIIKRLKGPARTKVAVTVWRKGWAKTREINITRDTIDVPSLLSQVLPGGIGYIRLASFAAGDARKGVKGSGALMREAISDFKRRGVKGVVLDLTNNPGGLLMSAVDVARVFLGQNKIIVSKRTKARLGGPSAYRAGRGEPLWAGPLTVLVNGGSASASEILAGALHDHTRAKLVGEKTFGKGSIQQPIPAWSTGGHIKLTIGYYYLPSGHCIHGPYRDDGGIKPDVEAKYPEIPLDELDIRWKIRDGHEIEKWLEAHFKQHEQKLRSLLKFDDYTSKDYPNFDQLMTALHAAHPKAKLTPALVRKELRAALISYLRNNLGEQVLVDPLENVVLRAGLVTLGEAIPGGLPHLPLYQAIKQRYESDRKALAAAATREGKPEAGKKNGHKE